MTPTKWGVPPAAVVAKIALSGFAFAHRTNSESVLTLAGTAGPMLKVSIDFVIGETGVKSRTGS